MIPPEKRLATWEKRRQTMLAKYGGADGLRRHYQFMQQRSMENPNKQKGRMRGGFSDPVLAKQASQLGVAARKQKHESSDHSPA